jgi:hypothetical protein
VSPIRAEERACYPKDWKAISLRIRERAGDRCECNGECGRFHGNYRADKRCGANQGCGHPVTGSKVVLTVAHLNHQPEDCRDENLKAMCQRCHLAYDAEHHAETARATRLAKRTAGMEPML